MQQQHTKCKLLLLLLLLLMMMMKTHHGAVGRYPLH
jgi:hypothetical protein